MWAMLPNEGDTEACVVSTEGSLGVEKARGRHLLHYCIRYCWVTNFSVRRGPPVSISPPVEEEEHSDDLVLADVEGSRLARKE